MRISAEERPPERGVWCVACNPQDRKHRHAVSFGGMMFRVTGRIALDDRDIKERFVRASGPGGQNVKKEATAVELRVDIQKSSLPPDVKERLIALGGRHVTPENVLVVDSRAHRSQERNRHAARARLLALLKRAASPPRKRKPTRAPAAARDSRLASKHLLGALKRGRSRLIED
jgi:ribosome-associated protein